MEKTQYQEKLDFLSSCRWWMKEAETLRCRIDDLNDQLTGIRAQTISDMPRGGKAMGIDDLVAKKVDLLALYQQDLARAEDARKAIYQSIRSVESICDRTILRMFYVDGMSISQIADVLTISERQIKRYKKNAVKNMQIPQDCHSMSQYVTGTI